MRTLSRRFLNRRTAAAKTEVTAVEFWSGFVCGEKLSRSGYGLCVVKKSSVAPALNVCLWRRKADEIASNSHHDRLSASVGFCNLRVCCDVDVHSRLDIRHQSDCRWRTGQSVSPT